MSRRGADPKDPLGYYRVLDLEPGADVQDIKKAYKRKQVDLHPNGVIRKRMRESAEYKALNEEQKKKKELELDEQLGKVNEAYRILENPDKKQEYDSGEGEFGIGGGDNPFADFFRGGGGFYTRGDPFGGHSTLKAKDITVETKISFSDLFNGVTKKFKIGIKKVCKKCNGRRVAGAATPCKKCDGRGVVMAHERSGMFVSRHVIDCPGCEGLGNVMLPGSTPCEGCKGVGLVREEVQKEINIRPGIQDGTKLAMKGQGNEMPGRSPGDIVFTVSVKDKDKGMRIGDHLVGSADIDALTLLCGGQVYYAHPDGRNLAVNIPPISGRLKDCILVPNEGFPGRKGRGDLYLRLNVVNNQRLDRTELSRYVRSEVTKSAVDHQTLRGRWEVGPGDESEGEDREHMGSAHGGAAGFAEDILRGFGFF